MLPNFYSLTTPEGKPKPNTTIMLNGFKTFITSATSAIASALLLFGMQPQADQVSDLSGDALAKVEAWEAVAADILADYQEISPALQEELTVLIGQTGELVSDAGQVLEKAKTETWPGWVAFIASIGAFLSRAHTRIRTGE